MKLAVSLACLIMLAVSSVTGDMLRKSIVFDKKTPDVFYCPIDKPTSFEKMFVRARPLKKLCEFKGTRLPSDYKSDCYNDVDETEWACREKKRIMMRIESEAADASVVLAEELSNLT